ncbi:hypothetical protein [Ensifer sp. MJa1]|uniref:hypothetical protein n=1 Tax=Ensifer sp. MJa1 TaxID=2919888 RepID=UPI00300BD33A
MTSTRNNIFKPGKGSANEKAIANDQSARGIVAAEKLARDKKTEKLKALRLERAAAAPATAAAAAADKKSEHN